jgi:hypothetical protein
VIIEMAVDIHAVAEADTGGGGTATLTVDGTQAQGHLTIVGLPHTDEPVTATESVQQVGRKEEPVTGN